ncbi:MAG: hypothetical protein M3P42_07360, partial [Actinomycetota bacterium]|nr:hypothetical protein [Actinomycetota bacterium]
MRLAAFAAVVTLLGLSAAGATPVQRHTGQRTILDRNGDNRLELAAGEGRVTRTDLGGSPAARSRTLLAFAHLADTQMVDEESPGRVE